MSHLDLTLWRITTAIIRGTTRQPSRNDAGSGSTTSCIESGNKIYEFFDVTYKPNCAVPMIDKSPKLEVACSLARKGLKVKIIDRFPVIMEVMKEYGDLFEYETCSSESTSKISTTPNGVY